MANLPPNGWFQECSFCYTPTFYVRRIETDNYYKDLYVCVNCKKHDPYVQKNFIKNIDPPEVKKKLNQLIKNKVRQFFRN